MPIDEAVLALLWPTLHDTRRAWKGFDWTVLDRRHVKGMIADPVGSAQSVMPPDARLRCSRPWSPGRSDPVSG